MTGRGGWSREGVGNTEGLLNWPGDKGGAATAEFYNKFKGSW